MSIVTATPYVPIDFGPDTVAAEVTQNVATLLSTVCYTVPYDRTLGLNPDYLDDTTQVTKAKLTAQIFELIRDHEPRAEIKEITFQEDDAEGLLIPTVRMAING